MVPNPSVCKLGSAICVLVWWAVRQSRGKSPNQLGFSVLLVTLVSGLMLTQVQVLPSLVALHHVLILVTPIGMGQKLFGVLQ
jgi:hypothetical protein